MKRLIAIALVVSVSTLALAQQGTTIGDIYIENVEVNIVSLDVFVTDKKGNPVAGLTAEDFVVYENRAVREITNFSEIREVPRLVNVPTISPKPLETIPEERSRKIIFFIDNETIHPFNRNKVFDQVRGFVGELLRPGDQAMLVTWNNGLKVQIPFTSLVSEFERTLIRLSGENTMKAAQILRRRQAERSVRLEADLFQETRQGLTLKDAYGNAVSVARAYAEESRNVMRAKSVALAGLMSTLAGVQGKKAFIYVGEEFPLQPGIELFQFVNDIFGPIALASPQQIPLSSAETSAPTESIVLDAIGRAANANGVTVYMLNSGGASNLGESPVETDARRSTTVSHMENMNRMSAFQAIAGKTGGLAFLQTDNIKRAFEAIERDFGTYYSIGYLVEPGSLGEKNIKVELRNKDYKLRTRSTFFTKSTSDQMVDGVVANLFYETSTGDLPIRIETDKPRKKRRGQYLVQMRIIIPTEALTLIPIGEKLAGKFSIYVGVGDGKGGVSEVNQQQQDVQVPVADFAEMAGKHFTFQTDLLMRKGENILAVAVLDNVSNLKGYSRTSLDVR